MKPTTLTESEVFAIEREHRLTAPLIEWNHVVRLRNGEHQRVNRFDYNLAAAAKSNRYIQLENKAWIKPEMLTRLPEPETLLKAESVAA